MQGFLRFKFGGLMERLISEFYSVAIQKVTYQTGGT